VVPVWAGEGIDLITDITSARDMVAAFATEAETALSPAGRR
jgi:nitronate monooxygenase